MRTAIERATITGKHLNWTDEEIQEHAQKLVLAELQDRARMRKERFSWFWGVPLAIVIFLAAGWALGKLGVGSSDCAYESRGECLME